LPEPLATRSSVTARSPFSGISRPAVDELSGADVVVADDVVEDLDSVPEVV
jgi:hypothetical protein